MRTAAAGTRRASTGPVEKQRLRGGVVLADHAHDALQEHVVFELACTDQHRGHHPVRQTAVTIVAFVLGAMSPSSIGAHRAMHAVNTEQLVSRHGKNSEPRPRGHRCGGAKGAQEAIWFFCEHCCELLRLAAGPLCPADCSHMSTMATVCPGCAPPAGHDDMPHLSTSVLRHGVVHTLTVHWRAAAISERCEPSHSQARWRARVRRQSTLTSSHCSGRSTPARTRSLAPLACV